MTKISLIEILTLLIATVILLLALYSATFDGGELINLKFSNIIDGKSIPATNAYCDTSNIDEANITFE